MATKKTVKKKATKAPKVKRKVEKRDFKKSFWFLLTEKELKSTIRKAVTANKLRNEKVQTFTDLKKSKSAEISELEVQIQDFMRLLDTQKEWREVDCIEVRDYQKLEVRYVLGKKVLLSRKMDEKEKQMAFTMKNKPINSGKNEALAQAEKGIDSEIQDVVNEETNKKTKKSAVDNVTPISGRSPVKEKPVTEGVNV